ncbi:MAG: hypothetical protein K8R49_01285 [Candidatus Cloacimonetes bacterium]|nr:hypothetical protein [Candidatus Cloacimonadota bacterium]
MADNMNKTEKIFLRKMLSWDQKKASIEVLINSIFLVLGGISIIVIAYLTFMNINNYKSIWVTLPGFLIGVLLLCIYIVGDFRIKERRKFASILRKLLTKGQ